MPAHLPYYVIDIASAEMPEVPSPLLKASSFTFDYPEGALLLDELDLIARAQAHASAATHSPAHEEAAMTR